jgi:hypothetical protein
MKPPHPHFAKGRLYLNGIDSAVLKKGELQLINGKGQNRFPTI